MKKFLLLLTLLISASAYAEEGVEIIAGFDDKSDLPILNNELRKLDEKNQDIDDRVTTLEADPGISASSQAEMESASSTTTYVSPGRTKYHPGVAKAFAIFDGTNTGTFQPIYGYNITSITRNSDGDYTATWDVDFSSANYVVVGIIGNSGAGHGFLRLYPTSPLAAGSCRFETYKNDGSANQDASVVMIVAYGDQ